MSNSYESYLWKPRSVDGSEQLRQQGSNRRPQQMNGKAKIELVDVAGIEAATLCLQSARVASNSRLVHFNC